VTVNGGTETTPDGGTETKRPEIPDGATRTQDIAGRRGHRGTARVATRDDAAARSPGRRGTEASDGGTETKGGAAARSLGRRDRSQGRRGAKSRTARVKTRDGQQAIAPLVGTSFSRRELYGCTGSWWRCRTDSAVRATIERETDRSILSPRTAIRPFTKAITFLATVEQVRTG
jgi:hypothetical protein